MKNYKIIYFTLAMILILSLYLYHFIWGFTTKRKAEILIEDSRYGYRVIGNAILSKDKMLREIEKLLLAKENVHPNNCIWIIEVLSSYNSESCDDFLNVLYNENNISLKLIASSVLLYNDKYPEEINAKSFIIRALRGELINDRFLSKNKGIAAFGLGWAKERKALPYLIEGLFQKDNYYVHLKICEAIRKINDPVAIIDIENALKSPTFHAVPEAFKTLICLGDKNAIKLGIDRVRPELDGFNEGRIVIELERVTGINYGFDREAWKNWWDLNKNNIIIQKDQNYCN